ncbi:MAG TPA: FtsQ-type POTRA domain-containing protein, partial [Longimicrobiales bacterium]|nr:FtsQ-type POTRA domain-containing protein [Longimicrobiales bacterium]
MTTRRVLRVAGLAGVTALLAATPFLAPKALRHLDVFHVREVEVTGTHLLDPYTLVRAAGLDEASSVFDDPDRWLFGVLTLPLVESVEVRRKLPAGVEIRVREVEPVALVAGSTLRPVDAAGRLLPVETAGALLDL